MLQNLAASGRELPPGRSPALALAYFARSPAEVQGVREALGRPLRVARLMVPLPGIEQRLASDVTSGRRDDLREATASIAAAEAPQ